MSSENGEKVQHLFIGAAPPLELKSGEDVLYTYVYLDAKSPPKEIMVQFNVGDWEHRAYWGADAIPFGAADAPDSPARRQMSNAIPSPGQWTRLEVKAKDIGLGPGSMIVGVSFDQAGGKVYWDKTGAVRQAVPEAPGIGDLMWAVFTSPEFQYIR